MKRAKTKAAIQWFRMTEDLKAQIRKYQGRVKKETGFEITLSAAIRDLIEKGLEVTS